jgi:4'-phosphopantetheinyl transferase EntD
MKHRGIVTASWKTHKGKLGKVLIRLVEYPLPKEHEKGEEEKAKIFKDLYPEEIVTMNQLMSSRGTQSSLRYSAGRIAARSALQEIGKLETQILNDIYGAPIFPPGCSGSISHKNNFALCGIIDTKDISSRTMVGVDIEQLGVGSDRLGQRILTGQVTLRLINSSLTNDQIRERIKRHWFVQFESEG